MRKQQIDSSDIYCSYIPTFFKKDISARKNDVEKINPDEFEILRKRIDSRRVGVAIWFASAARNHGAAVDDQRRTFGNEIL